jgi:hypothetical protein
MMRVHAQRTRRSDLFMRFHRMSAIPGDTKYLAIVTKKSGRAIGSMKTELIRKGNVIITMVPLTPTRYKFPPG